MTDLTPAILAAQRADALLAQAKLERRLGYLEQTIQFLRDDLSARLETVSESLEGLVAETKELHARLCVVEMCQARDGEVDNAHGETAQVVVGR